MHVRNATQSYKHLASFIDSSHGSPLLDIRELSLHIDELQYAKATCDIADLPSDNFESESKRAKLNRLGLYLTLWASRRRTSDGVGKPGKVISVAWSAWAAVPSMGRSSVW